jgi:hypothetical protein
VSDKFSVKKTGDSWKVRQSYVDMNLTSSRSATVPMMINKVAVKTDKIRIFPGSYTFATGNKHLDYGTSNTLLVKSLTDYPSMSTIELGLTDSGLKAFVASAKSQVEACVKQKKLAPSGCPFSVREASYQDIDESTISWKLDDDAFDNVKPRLDYQNPAVVTYSGPIPVTFSAKGEQFDRKATFGPTKVSGYSKMSANMTKEPVKVVFTR